jgi:uncharacterized membrane protein
MIASINFWPLIGVAVVAAGFVCRFNPMLVVSVAAVVTGLTARFSVHDILAVIGTDFIKARNLPLITLLPLPVIGVLERNGLREFVQRAIAKVKAATAGRVLILYLFVREASAAIGLMSLGGHAQMVRPLIVPMAEGVAKNRYENLSKRQSQRLRALAASTDNIGLFFGEDVFVAYGGILFTQTVLHNFGVNVDATSLAFAAVPIAVFAFIIHAVRLYRLDAWLAKNAQPDATDDVAASQHEECHP